MFQDFGEEKFNPKTLLEGLQENVNVDFQEAVRKAVVNVEETAQKADYKYSFEDIEFLPPVTPTNNVIAFGRNYKNTLKN